AASTNTRPAAGLVGITTRRFLCSHFRSSSSNEHGWGKKEPRMTVPEVRALLVHLLEVRTWDLDEILRWSQWRMARNRQAAASHGKRRAAAWRRRVRSRARDPAL